jgi:uncharacterized protein
VSPLEIMVLGHKMRDAQKRWPTHPQQTNIEVMALEKAFDEAIQPYMDYVRHAEAVAEEQAIDG